MQELSIDDLEEVSGGIKTVLRMLKMYVVDFTIDAIVEGQVGYTEAVEASGSGYCMLGA